MFCTSIHCMDGRIQLPIMRYLTEQYSVLYVDTITEAGPCKILAENTNIALVEAIIERIEISVKLHGSNLIAVSGHHDCAKNPANEARQREQILKAMQWLQPRYPQVELIGLWVGDQWDVTVVQDG